MAKVEEMNLASKDETKKLLQYLDPQNKGYVTFYEFNKKIRTDMTDRDENGNPKVHSYMAPNQEIQKRIMKNIEYIKQKENEIKQINRSMPGSRKFPWKLVSDFDYSGKKDEIWEHACLDEYFSQLPASYEQCDVYG